MGVQPVAEAPAGVQADDLLLALPQTYERLCVIVLAALITGAQGQARQREEIEIDQQAIAFAVGQVKLAHQRVFDQRAALHRRIGTRVAFGLLRAQAQLE
jgi:hypothetical protein